MGAFPSRSARGGAVDVDAASRALDIQLLDQQLVDLFTFKILCLGAGESGKSTVVKQLKLIHKKAIEQDELDLISHSLQQNVLDCMRAVAYARQTFHLDHLDPADEKTEKELAAHDEHARLPTSMALRILHLFQSPSYQAAYSRRSEFWILDSFPYYLKHLERFLEPGFVPTEEDAVMARVRTTGIVESSLEQKIVQEEPDEPETLTFRVVDVGGQRNERKKWMHCFSDVKAILFVVNLAGYNAVLFEDGSKNRLIEELELFEQVTNNPLFKDTPIFLFLNKKDLFESLVSECPLSVNFPGYTGDNSLSSALSYIECSFNQRLPAGQTVHIASVSARWKRDIKAAFDDVKKNLYDLNRKELLAQAAKINRQRRALTRRADAGAATDSVSNTARGKAEGEKAEDERGRAASESAGHLEAQGCWSELWSECRACWQSCWVDDEELPPADNSKTVHVGSKRQLHSRASSATQGHD